MQKNIEKSKVKEYNLSIQLVNNYMVCERDYTYGHIKEFIRLRKGVKKEAHRVISTKALLLFSYNINLGAVYDISGNLYYFEVFSDGNYRVCEVQKYKDISREVIYEEYIKKNS